MAKQRNWTIGESETRLPIKEGSHTVAYVQIARDDYEVAHLIKAAPKMLEMARDALACIEQKLPGESFLIADLRAVIAEAEPK